MPPSSLFLPRTDSRPGGRERSNGEKRPFHLRNCYGHRGIGRDRHLPTSHQATGAEFHNYQGRRRRKGCFHLSISSLLLRPWLWLWLGGGGGAKVWRGGRKRKGCFSSRNFLVVGNVRLFLLFRAISLHFRARNLWPSFLLLLLMSSRLFTGKYYYIA